MPDVWRLPPDPDPADADPAGADADPADAAAGTGAAARPQTLQYPSSIVPPQLVQVLIATVLPAVWIN